MTATSQQLARKPSVASGSVFRDRDNSSKPAKEEDTLLAPLPRMMPIAEMNDKAMQAYNARRKEIEDALQAQRAAKEEEERIEREQREAEEAAKRAVEEEAREKERKEREAREAEERNEEEENKKARQDIDGMQGSLATPKMEDGSSQKLPQQMQNQSQQSQSQEGQADSQSASNGQQQPQQQSSGMQQQAQSSNNGVFGDEQAQEGAAGSTSNYFDDSYNLLMDNFGMYGENGNGGYNIGGTGGLEGDDGMMEDDLFSQYMDQMGGM